MTQKAPHLEPLTGTPSEPLPVLLSDPHKDIAPHAYVVMVHQTRCLNCHTTGTLCATYARTNLKSQWGHKYITNLRPLKGPPRYNLPIEIRNAPIETIPFCSSCPDPAAIVRGLPYPPVENPRPVVVSSVSSPEVPKRPKAPAASKTTTDDLLKGLDI